MGEKKWIPNYVELTLLKIVEEEYCCISRGSTLKEFIVKLKELGLYMVNNYQNHSVAFSIK